MERPQERPWKNSTPSEKHSLDPPRSPYIQAQFAILADTRQRNVQPYTTRFPLANLDGRTVPPRASPTIMPSLTL